MSTGAKFTPSLTVRCDSKGKPGKEDRTAAVVLETGRLQPGTLSVHATGSISLTSPAANDDRLLREALLFRIATDGGRPQRRRWELLPNSDTAYRYSGEGETAIGAIFSPYQFLAKAFAAKLLTVEFQPNGVDGAFTSQFDPSGLKAEFSQHHACSLK
jgi:hypothetical protein